MTLAQASRRSRRAAIAAEVAPAWPRRRRRLRAEIRRPEDRAVRRATPEARSSASRRPACLHLRACPWARAPRERSAHPREAVRGRAGRARSALRWAISMGPAIRRGPQGALVDQRRLAQAAAARRRSSRSWRESAIRRRWSRAWLAQAAEARRARAGAWSAPRRRRRPAPSMRSERGLRASARRGRGRPASAPRASLWDQAEGRPLARESVAALEAGPALMGWIRARQGSRESRGPARERRRGWQTRPDPPMRGAQTARSPRSGRRRSRSP